MTDLPASEVLGAPAARPAAFRYGGALVMVAAATWAAVLADLRVHIPNLSLVFVLPVVAAAVGFGWGPALAAAVAGVVCYNFFLIEPRYTFQVADPSNVWALALLMVVAAMVSALAAQSRRQANEALEHARQARALQGLARALTAAGDRTAIMEAVAQGVHALFRAPALVLLLDDDTTNSISAPTGATLDDGDEDAAKLALAARRPARADAFPGRTRFDFWPVVTAGRRQAALGVEVGDRPRPDDGLMQIVTGHVAVALDREAYASEAAEARLEAQGERLKTDLLAAVSHDLRTPLSTILVTLQSLRRFGEAHDAATRSELLALAETETTRLARLVSDLLDMGRIEAGAVPVRLEPAVLAATIASAIERAGAALAGAVVEDQTPADLPLVMIDPALTETALANVLENAGRYGRSGGTVSVRAVRDGAAVVVEVLDQGPGFPADPEAMFGKFTRGVEGDGRPPGVGLGLSIAQGLLRAQGADIVAGDRLDGGGASVHLRLPVAEPAS